MMNCGGFPDTFEFSPIPRPFITTMINNMESVDEVKTVLNAFNIIYQKKGQLKYCLLSEISNDNNIETVKAIMNSAVLNGIFISYRMIDNNTYYFVNDKYGKKCIEKIAEDHDLIIEKNTEEQALDKSNNNNIYTMYENNIGQLTPLIIEELKIAEQEYPISWIEEAIKESVELNKRNWKYIKAILRNWQTKGKDDGKLTRHTETNTSRYSEGKYGSRVKR